MLTPMLATVGHEIPAGDDWTFEPKYDGVRVLAAVEDGRVALTTRNGNDKAAQFPEIVESLRALGRRVRAPFIVDGEIVAMHDDGEQLARFQGLQGRLHRRDAAIIATYATGAPAVLVALDLLATGGHLLVREPWTVRRKALERLMARARPAEALRLAETFPGEGKQLLARARTERWEGIIAKRVDVPYTPGARSPHWRKLKIEGRQEFVVGGWTEPRNSRQHIGALLLGYYDDDGRLHYAGHTGGGFTHAGLAEMYKRLARLERARSPFVETPRTNEPPHWTRPEVVVEVKFNQWTEEGRLRHPIFLGVRDDKPARDVRREEEGMARKQSARARPSSAAKRPRATRKVTPPPVPRASPVGRRIAAIESAGGDGTLALGRGASLDVSSLGKLHFPQSGYRKGDVMAYYAAVAPAILPLIEGRPLVLQRFPDGIEGKMFFQQNAPPSVPDGVRVEDVDEGKGVARRFVGGDLATLLYCVQLGAIEVHPWHSRTASLDDADYAIIDLDPGPKATFARVVQVAEWVHEELERAGLHGALKTSGASGLHVYLPLPPHTSYETSRLVAELVATRVASAHPREATVVRAVKGRAPGTVYVDYLQNVQGKSVAGPFSVRAREPGRVSTPLAWEELSKDLDPGDFTMTTVVPQAKERRAIWAAGLRRKNRLRGLGAPE